jgi:tRNA nucleotidyltransferase (CCA-adding enzyme)
MLNLTRKFLDDNIKRCRDTIKFYSDTENSFLRMAGREPEISKDAFWAQAQLDAYVRVANFMNDEPAEITSAMSNEEACRTAIELFINEAAKKPFDWHNGPKTIDEASALVKNNTFEKNDLTRGFMAVIYFWFNFQRKQQT